MENILKDLETYTVSDGIERLNSMKPKYPMKPYKPILSKTHSQETLEEYSSLFSKYEKEKADYDLIRNEYFAKSREIDSLIEKYIKEQSGLNSIPEKYQQKVYSLAWEEGHSNGYSEVYNYLCHLVEIFD